MICQILDGIINEFNSLICDDFAMIATILVFNVFASTHLVA
jgi:hypothetical protein